MAQLTEAQQDTLLDLVGINLNQKREDVQALVEAEKSEETMPKLIRDRVKTIQKTSEASGAGKVQKALNGKVKELFDIDTAKITPTDEEKGLTVEDVADAIKTTYKPVVDPTTLTEEQVKTHPAYKTLETNYQTEKSGREKAIADAKAEGKSEAAQAVLQMKAIQYRQDLGAVLPEDKEFAEFLQAKFFKKLAGVTEIQESDGTTTFWRNGKREENDGGFPVTAEEFFKSALEGVYTLQVSEQKNTPGAKGEQGKAPGGQGGKFIEFKGTPPKTQADFDKIVDDYQQYTPAALKEVQVYWGDLTKQQQ